jgi:hypothetical protein
MLGNCGTLFRIKQAQAILNEQFAGWTEKSVESGAQIALYLAHQLDLMCDMRMGPQILLGIRISFAINGGK